ncbi:1-deoxy-D-xylulose-5-phosphate reductoisomerase, partial [bacterium]|nr:1-deoxy-D-xylulose-5-phosphate reductoisomerase [bacterium]
MKNIVLLGCTGSIGTQTIDVVTRFPDQFRLVGVSARGGDPEKLIEIVHRYKPEVMVVTDEYAAKKVTEGIVEVTTRILTGSESHLDLAGGNLTDADVVVSALSGTAGLLPTLAAVEAGIDVALANKETLVTGGEFVISLAKKMNAKFYPVDSEHSAIHQCLAGIQREDLRRIILTCSGGPFSQRDIDLEKISLKEALAHPTWNMGRKIS